MSDTQRYRWSCQSLGCLLVVPGVWPLRKFHGEQCDACGCTWSMPSLLGIATLCGLVSGSWSKRLAWVRTPSSAPRAAPTASAPPPWYPPSHWSSELLQCFLFCLRPLLLVQPPFVTPPSSLHPLCFPTTAQNLADFCPHLLPFRSSTLPTAAAKNRAVAEELLPQLRIGQVPFALHEVHRRYQITNGVAKVDQWH